MKKFALVLVLAAVCCMGYAQSVDKLIEEYQDKKGVEYVNVGSFMMNFSKMFMDSDDKKEMDGMNIKSLNVLSLEDECSAELRAEFAAKAQKLDMGDYELLLTAKDDGEVVYIYGLPKKDLFKEVVILAIEPDECALVQLKGEFSLEKIKEMNVKNF